MRNSFGHGEEGGGWMDGWMEIEDCLADCDKSGRARLLGSMLLK